MSGNAALRRVATESKVGSVATMASGVSDLLRVRAVGAAAFRAAEWALRWPDIAAVWSLLRGRRTTVVADRG